MVDSVIVRGKKYSQKSTHRKKSGAKKKQKDLQSKGHNAVIGKVRRGRSTTYRVYARKK